MPFPIQKVNQEMSLPVSPDMVKNYLPIFENQSLIDIINETSFGDKDKANIKKLWVNCKTNDDGEMEVVNEKSISKKDIVSLMTRGFLIGDMQKFKLTNTGHKLLKESILNDNKSALCKQASKKIIAKNSYDFNDNILVRVNDKSKFGTKYILLPKSSFNIEKIEPIKISKYDIKFKKDGGEYKTLAEFSENELVRILHLACNVIKHKSDIYKTASKQNKIVSVPTNNIFEMSKNILEFLNAN